MFQGWPWGESLSWVALLGPHCALHSWVLEDQPTGVLPSTHQAELDHGPHLHPSQRPCPPTLGATGVAGHTSSRGGQEAPARAGRS